MGPLLAFMEDVDEDEEELEADSSPEAGNLPNEQLEEGEWIWATGLLHHLSMSNRSL